MCVDNTLTYNDIKSFSIITEDEHRRNEHRRNEHRRAEPPNGETFDILIFYTTNQVPELDLSGLHRIR